MDAVDDTAAQLRGSTATETGEADAPSVLAVLLDLHGDGWLAHSKVPLWTVLTNLMVLLNAHIALDSSNEVVIVGYSGRGSRILYSTIDLRPANDGAVTLKGTMIKQFKSLDEVVLSQVRKEIEAAAESGGKTTSVAGPLSLSLAYINRQILVNPKLTGHILIVSAEPEHVGSKYIPAMNSIFTAQKLRVPVDVANFGPPKSFLQQAADFTSGSYLEFDSDDSLVAIFTSTFLVSPAMRRHVSLATKPDVDFSAVCFVTKNIVEVGFVCSVCLCIMEKIPQERVCPVCNTHYEDREQRALES